MIWLSLLFGSLVGLSLGLTGGGGAIFAVPLLVYGLQVPVRSAVGISLAAVGVTAGIGFLSRWRLGLVEIRTGAIFALAGMIGAPLGIALSKQLPESLVLGLFALLMLLVAARMWRQATRSLPHEFTITPPAEISGPACQRDATGSLLLTSRCAVVLLLVGSAAGVLSGLFGVGGGFIIVPALVLFSGMEMHRAIGTSLLVITLVSLSGVVSHVWTGGDISPQVTGLFVIGGIAGLLLGQRIAAKLSATALQKGFALAIVAVAVFVLLRNITSA